MTAERGCARLSTAPCFEFAETGSKLFEHLREILMKFVIRNASASRQLSGYFASMRFDQQQCFVLSLITRMLADSIQHRPIFCNRFVEGICLELHAVSLFVITEFRFPTLIRHFAKIQSAELWNILSSWRSFRFSSIYPNGLIVSGITIRPVSSLISRMSVSVSLSPAS